MNPKNAKKSSIHYNEDANTTCDFGDGDISRSGVAYLTHTIHTHIVISTILRLLLLLKYIQFNSVDDVTWPGILEAGRQLCSVHNFDNCGVNYDFVNDREPMLHLFFFKKKFAMYI